MVDAGVRGIVSAAFRYGFRKEELQNLLCRQVNFADKNLHLYQGTAKNSQPRKVVLNSASLEEIKEAARVRSLTITSSPGPLSIRGGNTFGTSERPGTQHAKQLSCRNFCSTIFAAARLVEWSVEECPPLVAGRISGHLTDAIFQRYDITSDQDRAEAAEKN
jgi:hypothetical protein